MNKQELLKQAEKVCIRERIYKECLRKKEQLYAKMFLETNFEEELGLTKNATEKQKDYYIKNNEEYKKTVKTADTKERMYKYEKKVYDIMMLEVVDNE